MGVTSPTHTAIVANTMKGIRRTLGRAPDQKAPALTDDIRSMVDATGDGTIGARDRALVLLGLLERSKVGTRVDIEDYASAKMALR